MAQEDVAVLDFGSSTITVIIGRRGLNNGLEVVGKGETEYAGFCEGEFFRPEQLGQAIAKSISTAEAAAKSKISKLYIGVPGDFTVCSCKNVESNFGNKRHKITDADVKELHDQGDTFRDKAYTLINVQPIYYTVSNERRLIEPVGLLSDKLSGQISYLLAETKFINLVKGIMSTIGIEDIEFVSSVLAEALFLFDDIKRDQYVVLIDVGYITTSVAVARGDGLLSLHSFSLGGGNIAGDLANYFHIPFAEAEALKRRVTLTLAVSENDFYEVSERYPAAIVNEIVTARIAVIARTIRKCLDLCEYVIPESVPYSLTGGGISYIRGAKEVLADRLKKPIEIVAPRIPQMEVPLWSSSLGLLDLALNVNEPKKQSFFAKLFKK